MDELGLKTTINHATIKEWVVKHNGEPAIAEGIITKSNAGEMLRIDFHSHANEGLECISWEQFFKIFEEHKLMLKYNYQAVKGEASKSWKIVKR